MNQKSRDLRQETAPTVCATIEQFNRVSLAVIATVLQATDSSNIHCVHERSRTLARWIEVAQVIKVAIYHIVKNFGRLVPKTCLVEKTLVFIQKKV